MDGSRHGLRPKGRRPQHLDQPQLFTELIESLTTCDQPFEDADGSWGSRVTRPPGKGWRIVDFSHDRKTRWMRRVPVLWPVRPSAGGWRRR